MPPKLHAVLIAGSAALALGIGTLSAHAGAGETVRAAQQHAAALDATADVSDTAATGREPSDTATSVLDDPDASEILDVLMAAINAATAE